MYLEPPQVVMVHLFNLIAILTLLMVYRTKVGGWYVSVNATNNQIYQTLSTNTVTYSNLSFTPTTFIKRVPDARNLTDRTYRVRYVIPKDQNPPLPRAPISGFVLQPYNTDNTSYNLQKVYYIYDQQEIQKFERGVTDGIYYLTLLCASIAPSTSNFDDFAFSQNVNEVYPAFDRDNPLMTLTPVYLWLTMKSSVS